MAGATGAGEERAGRIKVRGDLTVPGHPEIFSVGDMMSLDKLPGVAEVAMQAGLYAANRIRHLASGNGRGGDKPFRYHDLGSAAYIARGRAVVSAGPLRLSGFIGWIFWLFIHIAFLTGFRNRFGAILTWWVAFTRDVRRERAFTDRAVAAAKENPMVVTAPSTHVVLKVNPPPLGGRYAADGQIEDDFSPSYFAVPAGKTIHVTVLSYDSGYHTFTAPMLGVNVWVDPAKGSVPSRTSFTFTAPSTGYFWWLCDVPCDPYSMSRGGLMQGEIHAVKA